MCQFHATIGFSWDFMLLFDRYYLYPYCKRQNSLENLDLHILNNDESCNLFQGRPATKVASSSEERDIFGAHYDEGRITHIVAHVEPKTELIWTTLAQRSIENYRTIEQHTGNH